MSSIKTWALAGALTFCTCAQADERSDLASIIASCTGRLSAELEFAWLMSEPEAEQLKKQRRLFMDILESFGPALDQRQQMALRIHAKVAHTDLLSMAYFGTNDTQASWAKHRARRQKSSCQGLLLES